MLAMTTALTIQTFRTQDRALRLRIQPRAPHIVPQAADWRHLSPGLAMALLLVAGMMWGGGNVASKTVLLHVGPLTTLALRCTLAFAIILALLQPWQRARQSVPFTASFLKSACGVALLFAGALVLQQCAYRWTSVTNASFLVNAASVVTPIAPMRALMLPICSSRRTILKSAVLGTARVSGRFGRCYPWLLFRLEP